MTHLAALGYRYLPVVLRSLPMATASSRSLSSPLSCDDSGSTLPEDDADVETDCAPASTEGSLDAVLHTAGSVLGELQVDWGLVR